MARNKDGRPEWFRFWRRNRRQLDIDELSIESRGIIFTNMMRYFDGDENLLPMNSIEAIAFNIIKINIDDAFSDYADMVVTNTANGKRGGRPPKKAELKNQNNQIGFNETEETDSENKNRKNHNIEDRSNYIGVVPESDASQSEDKEWELSIPIQFRGRFQSKQAFHEFVEAEN